MSELQDPAQNKPAENEIADYYDGVKKLEMQGHETGIRKARNALFVTAALLLVGTLVQFGMAGIEWDLMNVLIVGVQVGIFIVLGFWTKTKPYTAIVTGLIVYLLVWVAAMITIPDGRGIYGGIIVRIIILSILISALKPAKAWEDLKKTG